MIESLDLFPMDRKQEVLLAEARKAKQKEEEDSKKVLNISELFTFLNRRKNGTSK